MAKEFSIEQVQELERLEALENQNEWSPGEMEEMESLSEKYPEDKSLFQHAKGILVGGMEAIAWPGEQTRKAIHGPTPEGEAKTGEQIATEMGVPEETASE